MGLNELPTLARLCGFNPALHDPEWVQIWRDDKYLFTVLVREAATLAIAGFQLRASPKQ